MRRPRPGPGSPQAASPEPADQDQRGGQQLHRRPPSARHGQVQLQQVRLRAGALFPVPEPGGEAGLLPRVSVPGALRDQHGGGETPAGAAALPSVKLLPLNMWACPPADGVPELPENHHPGEPREGRRRPPPALQGRHPAGRPGGQLQARRRNREPEFICF